MTQSLPSRRVQRRQDLKPLNMKQLEIKGTPNIPNQEPAAEKLKLSVPGATRLAKTEVGSPVLLAPWQSPASYTEGAFSF